MWSFEYDQLGRQVGADDPDAGASTKTYDDVGQVLTTTDARDVTLGYTYDDLGRLTSVRDGPPSGPVRAEWVYDTLPGGLGMPTRSVRHEDGSQYAREVVGYDAAGRPTGTRVVVPSAETGLAGSYETTVTYRPDGSVGSMTFPAAGDLPSEQLVFLYNDVGQQTEFTGSSIYVWEAVYNKLGELVQRTLGSFGKRTVVNFAYDEPTGRLTGISATPELKPEALDLAYSYDDAGNVVRIADSPGSATPNDTQCFRYDHLGRMTDAWTTGLTGEDNCDTYPGPLGGVAPYRLVWTYDEAGNRLWQARLGPGGGTTTYTYPGAGQPRPHALLEEQYTGSAGSYVNTYAYDAAGNMVERNVGGDAQVLAWDPEGRVEEIAETAGTTEFVYDADGGRLVRRDPDGVKTLYLPGQELVYDPGTSTSTCTRYYTHLGTQIAVRTAGGLTWLVADHQGTAAVAVRDADMQVQRRRHLPFGGPRGSVPGWWAGDKGFLGGTEDPTGLTHLGARLYDPQVGRFVSVDPMMAVGVPQHFNGYVYANNSPVTLSDPSGLCPQHDPYRSWCESSQPASAPQTWCTGFQWGPHTCTTRPASAAPPATSPGCVGHQWGPPTCGSQPNSNVVAGGRDNDSDLSWQVYEDGTIEFAGVVLPDHAPDPALLAAGFWDYFNANIALGYSYEVAVYDALLYMCDPRSGTIKCDIRFRMVLAGAYYYDPDVFLTGMAAEAGGAGMPLRRFSRGRACVFSFVLGTLVLMADGTAKPIEQVQIGDVVLASDPETGATARRVVTDTVTGTGVKALVEVTVATRAGLLGAASGWPGAGAPALAEVPVVASAVAATSNHPFWTVGLGTWTLAADLQPGHQRHTPTGPAATVTAVAAYTATITVHNLSIASVHTYFVLAGDTPVLVHNSNPGCDKPLPTQQTGRTQPFTNAQATDLAAHLGYRQTPIRLRGERVFTNGKLYIVQDTTSHTGGTWKVARSPKALNSKSSRIATTDALLTPIGP